MNDVGWSSTPRPDTDDWTERQSGETGQCESCRRPTRLRPDPMVGQKVCRPCWEALMFDD